MNPLAVLVLVAAVQEAPLRVSWAPPEELDPHKAATLSDARYVAALFEGLTVPAADGVTVDPGAAESWSVAADGVTWTFRLRASTWSNGDPVRAGDFVWAWRRALRLGCPFVGLFRHLRGVGAWIDAGESRPEPERAELGFEAVDVRTLKVVTARRAPWLPDLLSFHCFVPLHAATVEAGRAEWVKPGQIVTNGPYLYQGSTLAELGFARNPKHGNPALAAAPARVAVGLHSSEIATKRFREGSLDWIAGEQIADDAQDRVRFDTWGTFLLRLNVGKPPFDRPAVRCALAAGIDRAKLVEGTFATPRAALVPPGFPGWPGGPGPAFDPAAALDGLMKESNFDLSTLPAIELLAPDVPAFLPPAQRLRDSLEKGLGLKVRLRGMKPAPYARAVAAGDFHAALGGWMGEYFDPVAFLEVWVARHPGNGTGWADAEFESLLGKAAQEPDPSARLRALARAEDRLLREAPVIPLWGAWDSYLATERVQGLIPNPMSRFPLRHLRQK